MHVQFARAVLGLALACVLSAGAKAADAPQPVTPAKLVVAQQIVEVTHAKETGAQVVAVVLDQMAKGMQIGSNTEINAYLSQLLKDEMAGMLDKMSTKYAEVYASSFTETELHQLLDLYSTPAGQMLINKLPQVMQQTQIAIAPLIPAMQKDMIVKLFDHVCKAQKCSVAQRSQLADSEDQLLKRIDQQVSAPHP